ncbi:hypothetical protein MUO83_04220 [Candidatus Bathyarchaeota archaeon]|jgi:hypothetical protein|nr:hypothetical protein [Candidatus Bathyarchaeota archaeon]
MLEELVFGFWFALGVYVSWYVFKAKDFQPLTLDDLALIWKLHKHQSGCKSSCIHDLLVRNDEVVGFKCECGHEFIQKRPITQRAKIATQSGRLFSFQNTSDAMENLGLTCLHIKKI